MKIFGFNFTENPTLKRTPLINKLFIEFSQMANTLTKKIAGRVCVWLRVGGSA
jgi:hypothetical protein